MRTLNPRCLQKKDKDYFIGFQRTEKFGKGLGTRIQISGSTEISAVQQIAKIKFKNGYTWPAIYGFIWSYDST